MTPGGANMTPSRANMTPLIPRLLADALPKNILACWGARLFAGRKGSMTNAGDWFDSEAAKARHEKLRKAKDWFNSDFVKHAAQQQGSETLAWLRRNDRSFTAAGEERREPWWPQPKTTDHVGLKVRRLKHLLDRAYEHGIQHFMFGLKEKGAVEARLGSRHIN